MFHRKVKLKPSLCRGSPILTQTSTQIGTNLDISQDGGPLKCAGSPFSFPRDKTTQRRPFRNPFLGSAEASLQMKPEKSRTCKSDFLVGWSPVWIKSTAQHPFAHNQGPSSGPWALWVCLFRDPPPKQIERAVASWGASCVKQYLV